MGWFTKEEKESEKEEDVFPLDRILSGVSPHDYCTSVSKTTAEYDLVGVHLRYRSWCKSSPLAKEEFNSAVKEFCRKIPSDAEVVIGYQNTSGMFDTNEIFIQISGTALVPKEKSGNPYR